jgi:hypothetical protein
MSDCRLKDHWRIGQRSNQVVTIGYSSQINDRDRLRRTKGELNNVLFPIPQLVKTARFYRFKDQ